MDYTIAVHGLPDIIFRYTNKDQGYQVHCSGPGFDN